MHLNHEDKKEIKIASSHSQLVQAIPEGTNEKNIANSPEGCQSSFTISGFEKANLANQPTKSLVNFTPQEQAKIQNFICRKRTMSQEKYSPSFASLMRQNIYPNRMEIERKELLQICFPQRAFHALFQQVFAQSFQNPNARRAGA